MHSDEKSEIIRVGGEVSLQPPTISVVIPAYNVSEYIAATLDSALSQTSKDYEIILVNDGSPDTARLEKIIEPYIEKITYITQVNGGVAAARNTAIENARGEIIAFLDGDDMWHPEFLASQIDLLVRGGYDMVYCDAQLFGMPSVEGKTFMQTAPSNGEVTVGSLLDLKCNVITSGTIARKSTIEAAGMFGSERILSEDFYMWIRIAKIGARIGYQRKALAKYRISPFGLSSHSINRVMRGIDVFKRVERTLDLTTAERETVKRRLRGFESDLAVERGKALLLGGEFDQARASFREANEHRRSIRRTVVDLFSRISPKILLQLYTKIYPNEIQFIADLVQTDGSAPGTISRKSESLSGPGKVLKMTEPKIQSLKQQSAWLLAAKLIAFVFSFALPLLIVRSLTQSAVGQYREAFLVITNAVILLPLGFSMSAFYFLARETERRGAAILNILLFNFLVGGLAAITLFIFPSLIGDFFMTEELTRLGPIIGVVIWISIFSAFLETSALANSEVKWATYFIVLSSFSKTLLMGGAVIIFASVEAFIYAAIIQSAIQTIILLFYLRSRFPGFWRGFDGRFFIEQAKYAIPFGLTSILWAAQNDIHNYFVVYKFSDVDFAIYSYGCFQLPLIGMLSESVSSVLIPRMNTLQQSGDRDEMIRLTARAMQKLALIYFPIYVFLMITAGTFVTTLFTHQYERSVPIFMINLTILPFGVLITDPIVRSYKELGRVFLLTRILVLTLLISLLYFSLGSIGLVGIITAAVGAILLEKFIGETMIVRKLGLGLQHLRLLKAVGKTAASSVFAGVVTFIFYTNLHVHLEGVGEHMAAEVFSISKASTLNFLGGSFVLLISGLVYAPVYLLAVYLWGLIEDSEKEMVMKYVRRVLPKRVPAPFPDTQT